MPRQLDAVRSAGLLPDAAASPYRYAELDSAKKPQQTALATESALAISYNGLSQAVMMVSPLDLDDFVVGFTIANRIIQHID